VGSSPPLRGRISKGKENLEFREGAHTIAYKKGEGDNQTSREILDRREKRSGEVSNRVTSKSEITPDGGGMGGKNSTS